LRFVLVFAAPLRTARDDCACRRVGRQFDDFAASDLTGSNDLG
jgi:hypothetical protein